MTRKEKDYLGEMEIPVQALYGIHAKRAADNFPDQTRFHKEWFMAMGLVKQACYLTVLSMIRSLQEKFGEDDQRLQGINQKLNLKERRIYDELALAAESVARGEHFGDFIVPAISGGAGTSINMNVNEIIANAALKEMGEKPGGYHLIDPIEQANIFQSTNDVVPTALKIAVMQMLTALETVINGQRFAMEQLETGNHGNLRVGYTQMQEAVPSSFGKLFSTYSEALSRDWWRVSKCFERIKQVNLGGGAIGTGMAIPRFFIMEAVSHLQHLTGLPLTRSENLADATSNLDPFVEVHATLKSHAVNLEKMVSDLRLLASDIGGAQISLKQVQVGSSVMPGKINPVIPEFVISMVHRVYANDSLITSLAARGCLELNAYLPVIGHAMLESIKNLIACNITIQGNLLSGLRVHAETGGKKLFRSPSITTAIIPLTGYHKASELARLMKEKEIDIFAANEILKLVDSSKLEQLLKPENLLKLGYVISDLE